MKASMADETKTAQRPTLKTIANLSGLAVPTVSRALNDAPDIGESTKLRVREIAREIGYSPNRAGLRLRTGKTNVIALIISTEHDLMNRTARLITSIASGTRNTPYHMIITPYFPDQDPMDPVRYVTDTRSADGILLNQTQPEDPRIEYLMRIGFPFATHGRTNWCDRHAYYDFDNGIFGAEGVKRLVARGRKNLVLIAPRQDQTYAIEMIVGARAAAETCGIEFTILETTNSDSPSDEVEAAFSSHMALHPQTDGVITASSNAAMAVVGAIEGKGLAVGREVDVMAKDSLPFLKRFRSEILIMREDVARAGEFLCSAVLRAIDQPDEPPMQFLEVPKEEF